MTAQSSLQGCARLCRQFGGHLKVITQRAYDDLFFGDVQSQLDRGLHEAPFTEGHGLHWGHKVIYAVQGRERVGAIIHEMGHVFADLHHPKHPKCCEWSWFGWEVAIARQLRAYRLWSMHNANYVTSINGREWAELTAKQRQDLVMERLGFARDLGLVGARGIPNNVR